MVQSRVFQLLLVFLSITMLVSTWLSIFIFNPLIILFVSLVTTYFLVKKFRIEKLEIPLPVIALSFLALILAAFPLLFIHPFFNSSADGLHSIITRTLADSDSSPANFQPYSELTLTYSIGFHFLPALVAKFLPIEPISLLNWFFGLLFVFLMPIAFYLFVRELFRNDFQAIFATILLIGSKIIFQNFYFGLYPYLTSITLLFFAAFLLLKRNWLFALILPVIFLLNPGGVIIALPLFAFLALLKKDLFFVKALPSFLLSIPMLLRTYFVLFANFFTKNISSKNTQLNIIPSLPLILSALLWIGWIPLIATVVALAISFKTKFDYQKKILFAIFSTAFTAFFVISPFSAPFAGKIVELYSIGAILFSSAVLLSVEMREKIILHKNIILSATVLLVVLSIFASTTLTNLAGGSKISTENAELAMDLYNYDPSPKKAFYLIKGASKFAEYSVKMPYDVFESGFLFPVSPSQIDYDSNSYNMLLTKHELRLSIIGSDCFDCIADLEVDYVIVYNSENVTVKGFAELMSNDEIMILAR